MRNAESHRAIGCGEIDVFFELRGPSQSRNDRKQIRGKMARISVTQRSASRATTSRQSRLPSCSSSSSRRLIDIAACHRLTASPRPATKYFESDERSKLLSPGPINNTSILRVMREAEIHTSPPVLSSPSCVDCSFVVCEDADCLAELNPAPPACSGFDSCPSTSHQVHETCTDPVCEMEGCDGGEACDGNFEEFVSCQPSPLSPTGYSHLI